MSSYPINDLNKIKRGSKRATYDVEQVNEILDAGFMCHISYIFNGRAISIPTAYGREGDKLFIHGAVANRMMKSILDAGEVSMTITHLDGLVLARSGFHHSANYRSVVVFGKVRNVTGTDEKNYGLKVVMDQMLPGRWEECRLPNEKELKATLVLEISIETASAKVRTGGPVDDEEDYELPIWAGELPLISYYSNAVPDESMTQNLEMPESVKSKQGHGL